MLDNFVKYSNDKTDTSLLEEALKIIPRDIFETEASGNINLKSIEAVAKTGVDFASTGSLTHSVTALDISLKFN